MNALQLLDWYAESGVDEIIEHAPVNRFALVATQPKPAPTPIAQPVAEALPVLTASPPAAAAAAQRIASACSTYAELETAIRNFDGLAIKRTATQTVIGDGNPDSGLLLIGEAPGAEEDKQGIPFCGPSGQLLDKMMQAAGFDRTKFYITNTVYWRPPGNRQPSIEETAVCRPFMERQIALLDPKLILLVGGVASKAVLQTDQGITRLRGKSFEFLNPANGKSYPVLVTYHPSYLLRTPTQKRQAWIDMLSLQSRFAELMA